MMPLNELDYWAARAAEERRMAASLPDGPPALAHRALAELYEQKIRAHRVGPEAGDGCSSMALTPPRALEDGRASEL